MIVLSRYPDERIRIGEDIIITIVCVRGPRVRIGIEAPADVTVDREEVFEAKRRDKREKGGEA